jgi:hypothetical protein
MSKKKDRAWFVCRQWTDLVARHHASDTEVNRALKPIRKSWGGGSGTRVAKSTLLRCYDVMLGRHDLGSAVAELVFDTRLP